MHPVLIKIGKFSLNSYGFMIAVGFLLSLFFLMRRARRVGLKPMDVFDTAILVLLCGIVGARVLHVVLAWDTEFMSYWQKLQTMHRAGEITAVGKYFQFFVKLIAVWEAGLAFFGGFLAAMAALAYSLMRRHLPLRRTLDVFAGVLPLGHMFGRLGCFLAGCCYGRLTDSIFGVCFPPGSPAYAKHYGHPPPEPAPVHSEAVHPTQLYAAGYNLLIFALLTWVFYRRRRAGDVAWTYAICYGVARFTNEFFRADTPNVGPFTVFQYAAAGVAIFGAVMLALSFTKEREPMPEPWEPEDEPEEDQEESSAH